jgi:hypothetical protein
MRCGVDRGSREGGGAWRPFKPHVRPNRCGRRKRNGRSDTRVVPQVLRSQSTAPFARRIGHSDARPCVRIEPGLSDRWSPWSPKAIICGSSDSTRAMFRAALMSGKHFSGPGISEDRRVTVGDVSTFNVSSVAARATRHRVACRAPATREIRIIDCENRDGEVTTRFRPLRSWSPGGRMTNIGMFACQIPAHQAQLQ